MNKLIQQILNAHLNLDNKRKEINMDEREMTIFHQRLAIEKLETQRAAEAIQVAELQQQLAEARATAADLLAALRETLDALYNETHGQLDSHWIHTTKAKANAAIARAEGHEPLASILARVPARAAIAAAEKGQIDQ